jgi:predicted N-acetyltransferase YhbS
MFETRPSGEQDREEILELSRLAFGDEFASQREREWQWQWFQDPRLPEPGYRGVAVRSEGRIVGTTTLLPVGLHVDGDPVEVWWQVCTAVHPDFRRQGIGALLQDGMASLAVFGQGVTTASLAMLEKCGYRVLDTGGFPEPDESRRWPMYGHDAQRTGCADCIVDVVTAVEPGISTTRVAFAMPYPNPAVGSTAFRYTLPSEANVRLEIFDQRGRKVRTLVRAEETAGDHLVSWDVRDQSGVAVSRGHYFGRLSVDGRGISERITRRVVIMD